MYLFLCIFSSQVSFSRLEPCERSPVWVSSERWILCACVGSAPLKCGGTKQKGCTLKKKNQARGINNHPFSGSHRNSTITSHYVLWFCSDPTVQIVRPMRTTQGSYFWQPVCYKLEILFESASLWHSFPCFSFSHSCVVCHVLRNSSVNKLPLTSSSRSLLAQVTSHRWLAVPSVDVYGNLTSCWWSRWVWLFKLCALWASRKKNKGIFVQNGLWVGSLRCLYLCTWN